MEKFYKSEIHREVESTFDPDKRVNWAKDESKEVSEKYDPDKRIK